MHVFFPPLFWAILCGLWHLSSPARGGARAHGGECQVLATGPPEGARVQCAFYSPLFLYVGGTRMHHVPLGC